MATPIPTCPSCLTRHPQLAGDKSPSYFLCSACKEMVNYFPPSLDRLAVATLARWLDAESGRTFTIRAALVGRTNYRLALWQDARNLSGSDPNLTWLVRRTIMSWDTHPTYSLPFDEWVQLGQGVADAASI